ncbi:MAG: bifunctional lytic transglycosylase/C40 family peptidase [Acidimicrobiales bacterium]|nr:bifunctional lytic transglycosylase/C40 family peptidase [Acidimicrobiales bacterium]
MKKITPFHFTPSHVIAAVVTLALGGLIGLGSLAAAAVSSSPGASSAGPGGLGSSVGGLAAVPVGVLAVYGKAARGCPGMPWQVLAAIGTIESSNGTSDLPGVRSGANPAGAEGPMQFEPATFAEYAEPVPPGGHSPPSPYDLVDAVYTAARMLCADGAATASGLGGAIYAYNHSSAYVASVLAVAASYGWNGATRGRAASVAVEYALAQLGTPYRWGGETPGVGFDCSGLVQVAYMEAGVSLPRVALDQYAAGPGVPVGAPLQPGDLVFFGPSFFVATHVGLVVDPAGMMVDAPYSGAAVRVEPFAPVVGAAWGSSDIYIGATAPG